MRLVIAVLVALGLAALAAAALLEVAPPKPQPSVAARKVVLPPPTVLSRPPALQPCPGPAQFSAAADRNRAALTGASVNLFGVAEQGWGAYAPLIEHEVATACAPDSAGFAAAVSNWQAAHGLVASGEVDQPLLSLLATTWLLRRPFVLAMKTGCPASPPEATLATATAAESFGGKTVMARPAALEAYRRLMEAARRDLPLPAGLLTIASAYRGPVEEAARCADGGCGNPARAHCSAHRTGLAFDFYLGAAPGRSPFSTADADRLTQAQSPAYRWLVQHAGAFGFVPYPYEPWHWEWTGEAP